MKFCIHRGTDQIGGSCIEIQSKNGNRLLLDAGMPLAKPDGGDWPRGTMIRPSLELQAEGILPRISGLYNGTKLEFLGLVLSHAHLDHHGLAHYLHPSIPVYGSKGTIEMLRASKLFIPNASIPENVRDLPKNGKTVIGPFTVYGFPVDHSAPDSRAILVEADGKRLLYTGDLRAHGRQAALFDLLPEKAGIVDVLILEGTTMGQPQGSHGFNSEVDVERRLSDLLIKTPGIVITIASGQNIDRAVSVYRAALNAGRELVLDPYQAYIHRVLKNICPEIPQYDSPSVRVKFIRNHVEKLKVAGLWNLACDMSRAGKVTAEQLAANPASFVYLARSSGATVALLRYLIQTTMPTVVWSQWGGYLKKGGPVPQFCIENGIKPVLIHSGGHAHPEDLARLASRINPKVVVPIHTERASLFSSIISNVKEIHDGELVEVA